MYEKMLRTCTEEDHIVVAYLEVVDLLLDAAPREEVVDVGVLTGLEKRALQVALHQHPFVDPRGVPGAERGAGGQAGGKRFRLWRRRRLWAGRIGIDW